MDIFGILDPDPDPNNLEFFMLKFMLQFSNQDKTVRFFVYVYLSVL